MKAKVHRDRDDARAAGNPEIKIETSEDCQLVQDRYDALKEGPQGESEKQESTALSKALERWHASR